MRWCSFTTSPGAPPRLGAVSARDEGERVLDVGGWAKSRGAETPLDLVDLVASSAATQERVTDMVRSAPEDGIGWVRVEEVRFHAPLRDPATLRQVVAREGVVPVFTHVPRRGVLGPDDALTWPGYTEKLDYACQVAAVIGRRGRDLDPAEAVATVFGYAPMVQWSARDVGREVATSLGPWVVSPDEWEPRAGHRLTVDLGDGPVEAGTSDGRPWTFGQALSWVSQGEDLEPTDVVGLGPCPAGTGRESERWVRAGQRLVLDVAALGQLACPVAPSSTDTGAGSP